MTVIALEGLPRSGKTTIIEAVRTELNIPVFDEIIDEQGNNVPHGQQGGKPREFYVRSDINKWLAAHKKPLAVLDRSYLSSLAHSICQGDEAQTRALYNPIPEPDYFIYLDAPVNVILDRIRATTPNNRGIWTDEKSLRETQLFYEQSWKDRPGKVFRIDATQTPEQVWAETKVIIEKLGGKP